MKGCVMNRGLKVLCLWTIAGVASAVTTNAVPPPGKNPPPPESPSAAAAKAMADDSSGLRKGTVEAVSMSAGTFNVYGQRLSFDPRRVRVFGRDGKSSSIYNLKSGANVRFSMDSADPAGRRVAVIYID